MQSYNKPMDLRRVIQKTAFDGQHWSDKQISAMHSLSKYSFFEGRLSAVQPANLS